MNQEKIGKFICECRKKKNMTQGELAEKLGVSDRTIGNWENGRNMPDLSLFKPICDELGITINELLSGEKIKKDIYQEKLEENIINTIDYSNKKIRVSNNILGISLIIIGLLLSFSAVCIFPSDSSWGSIYSIIGTIISIAGLFKLTKKLNIINRLLICTSYFILFMAFLITIDYISVVTLKQIPRFCLLKTSNEIVYECDSIFYNYYEVNSGTKNKYIIIDKEKKYVMDNIPITPFNRTKAGIDNIIKYQNKYLGKNSNTGNLIRNLPLSEYGYDFKIDTSNLGLIIDYHITDWYINDNKYLEKSLVYNAISIFSLIENANYIKFNFSGNSYNVKRSTLEENYPHYQEIKSSKEGFNIYLENKLYDNDFISEMFNKIINNN